MATTLKVIPARLRHDRDLLVAAADQYRQLAGSLTGQLDQAAVAVAGQSSAPALDAFTRMTRLAILAFSTDLDRTAGAVAVSADGYRRADEHRAWVARLR